MTTRRFLPCILGLAACLVLAQSQAVLARAKMDPLRAQSVSLSSLTLGADCCAPQNVCCPKPCITFRHHGPKLCCDCCKPPVPTVLSVKNPCACCPVEVPVCLPGCCTGEPTVCCGTGIFGRDVVTYEWCCGYSVRVAFKRTGDLIVTTWGR